MSNGTWNSTEMKTRPGLYNRFVTTANARVRSGPSGVVGIPIKADWGPVGVLVGVADEAKLTEVFGIGGTVNLVKRALYAGKKYKPNKVVVYRMATASAAAATASVAGTLKLTAKYPGTRGNYIKFSVTENILDSAKKDVKLYEGAALLATYTVVPNDIIGLVKYINHSENSLVIAEKLGDTPLAEKALTPLVGGDSGASVTTAEYLKALDAFEPVYINTIVPDGATNTELLTTFVNWTKRIRTEGKEVMLVIGGSAEADATPDISNQRSKNADHEGVVNVIVGTVSGDGSTTYTSAETACQIAGLIAGTPINKSITYKELEDVSDVTVNLTNDQIVTALKNGSFVLARDYDPETYAISVRVEQGINTLTSYTEEKDSNFSKIKVIRTLDTIDYDTGRYAAQSVIGELDNDADGQAALVSGIKLYLETLANAKAISNDFLTELDTSLVSEGDYVYLNTKALAVDKIEKIFNTINV